MISSSDVAEKLSAKEEEKLEQILKDAQEYWDNAECYENGATNWI